jgi:single-stranded-DNA-specific exonuclease
MGKRWRIQPHDAERIARLERSAGIPTVVAQLLAGRGVWEAEAARSFLDAKLTSLRDPDELPGLPAAADRIVAALRARRPMVVYGDYDADGMTATAILVRCLKLLGADVSYYVPNRLDDGYGLNDEALRRLAEQGASLIITVDCGIASLSEADTARALGLELIITDHHEMQSRLPDADAIVHPRLPGSSYPFGGLCGAGVAFKLAWGICQRACGARRVTAALRDFLLQAVGLAAIGTVADVVPLLDENRLLVRHGLKSLSEQPPLGLKALLEVTRLNGQKRNGLASEDIGFVLGPRLNAAGRLGQAQLGVELLTTECAERAQKLASYIHEMNTTRDHLERGILQCAARQIKERFDPHHDPALVLDGEGWHAGVIGIVAGRLAEKYHRPVVIVSWDTAGVKPGVGSARSACGLELHKALAACDRHLLRHGGHAAAAGLQMERQAIEAFRESFCGFVASNVRDEDRVAEIMIDAEAPLSQLTSRTVHQIELLAPFGEGNRRPVLCATGVELAAPPKTIGGGDRHLSLRVRQHRVTLRGVAFGQGEWADPLSQHQGPLDIAYSPVINEFRGFRSVEVHLVDWRPSTIPAQQPVRIRD